MLQLIINADDLGLTPGCNDGIIKGLTQGIVTDTTLMVNTPYTQDAVDKLQAEGIKRVGLHLNLTLGEPILSGSQVPSLVDAQGKFHRKIDQAVAAMRRVEVERELQAQVEKFLSTGLDLTHLDSHHHAHAYPEILEVVMHLAQQLQVPMRQTDEAVCQTIRRAGIATTDFIALDFYEEGVNLPKLQEILLRYPQGTLEVMCHPAIPDPALYAISSYHSWRQSELEILTCQEMREFIEKNGVKLVGFDALLAR